MEDEPEKEKRSGALSDQIVDLLLKALSNGEVRPGELIRESVVARQLGVSRGPLREALSQLEGRQIVERVHGQGVRVVESSKADLASLFEVRAVLEGLACRLACINATDADLDAIDQLSIVRPATEVNLATVDAHRQDEDFHFLIIMTSGNPRLIAILMENLYFPIRLYRYHRARHSAERVEAARREHRTIVACLRQRDPDAAERAMREHIENARKFLITDGYDASPRKPKLRFN